MKNIFVWFLVFCISCKTTHSQISTFSNPIVDISTRDAVVTRIDKFYYLVYSDRTAGQLQILKSQFLTDFRNAEKSVIYKLPTGYTWLYPSSFLEYRNDLYLYFHMNYRMFVLKAYDPKNPMGIWSAPTRLLDHIWNDTTAHGATFQLNNELYFVFSSPTESNPIYNLYIAKMSSPTRIVEPVVLLLEQVAGLKCWLEAPSFLYNREKLYMVFTSCTLNSTTGSTLSYMSIETGMTPMLLSNWKLHEENPVFQGNAEEDVYYPRFSEFTTSPDGTETWMIYTASIDASDSHPNSRIRIEKIDWDRNEGFPKFPIARANGYQQELPSGEPPKFLNPLRHENSNDGHVFNDRGTYYMVTTYGTQILMLKSDKLYDFRNAETATIYTSPERQITNSASLFELNGQIYLYFALLPVGQPYLSLYVSKAENRSDLMGNWGAPTRLLDGVYESTSVSHGAVLEHNDQLYFLWVASNKIYIASMSSPTQVDGPAVLLKEPRESWECLGGCGTDYPSLLYRNNTSFLVYTASTYSQRLSSLSYLSIDAGRNPLDVTSWYNAPGPLFQSNYDEHVYGPYHASFTSSPDGLETWMLYLAYNNSTDYSHTVRLERIVWNETTRDPVFPRAHGFSHPQAISSYFKYFANPVTYESTVSPGVIRVGDFYHMLLSDSGGSEIVLLKSGKLTDFRNAERKVLYSVPEGSTITGSSKMHKVEDQLYIYLSMAEHNSTSNVFVLQALDSSNPMGLWNSTPVLLSAFWKYPAFQATVLEHGEAIYMVWVTPHPATGFNSIFLAKMENATLLVDPVSLITHPTELWECDGGCSNEAPYFIYNEGTAYMVYSVGSACKGGNALTYMSIGKDKDPLNVMDWSKATGKVFSENRDESVFCPAHATFTLSPDGKETWMMYHATDSPHPDAIKTAHIENISWDGETREPVFPEPHGHYHQQVIPSQK